jgi:hypothetical protein
VGEPVDLRLLLSDDVEPDDCDSSMDGGLVEADFAEVVRVVAGQGAGEQRFGGGGLAELDVAAGGRDVDLGCSTNPPLPLLSGSKRRNRITDLIHVVSSP